MRKGIELIVLDFTDEQLDQIDAGIKHELSEIGVKPMMFYTIDNLSPEEGETCRIVSGGFDYITLSSYREVLELIEQEALTTLFN